MTVAGLEAMGMVCMGGAFVVVGAVIGGYFGSLAAWLLYLRQRRVRETQGTEVLPDDDLSSGCAVLFFGSFLGSVLGGGAVVGAMFLLAALGAN